MIVPNMVLVGSTARNVGKTTFCVELINKWKNSRDITGLKVTAVKSGKGVCQHGNDGCGVCTSFSGDYEITEETEKSTKKDTKHLLLAGANRVFWIKCLQTNIEEALIELFAQIPKDTLIVCESNALAEHVEPGVAVLMHKSGIGAIKPSSAKLAQKADFILDITDRSNLYKTLEKIEINEKPEAMYNGVYKDCALLVLAGGKSRRMGRDKAALKYLGKSFLETLVLNGRMSGFNEVIISGSDEKVLGAKNVLDELPERGPLGGLHAGLKASKSKYCFAVAVDTPKIDFDALTPMVEQHISGGDKATLLTSGGKLDPLVGVYNSELHLNIYELIKDGSCRIIELFKTVPQGVFEFKGDTAILDNINTPVDYENLLKQIDDM